MFENAIPQTVQAADRSTVISSNINIHRVTERVAAYREKNLLELLLTTEKPPLFIADPLFIRLRLPWQKQLLINATQLFLDTTFNVITTTTPPSKRGETHLTALVMHDKMLKRYIPVSMYLHEGLGWHVYTRIFEDVLSVAPDAIFVVDFSNAIIRGCTVALLEEKVERTKAQVRELCSKEENLKATAKKLVGCRFHFMENKRRFYENEKIGQSSQVRS